MFLNDASSIRLRITYKSWQSACIVLFFVDLTVIYLFLYDGKDACIGKYEDRLNWGVPMWIPDISDATTEAKHCLTFKKST